MKKEWDGKELKANKEARKATPKDQASHGLDAYTADMDDMPLM